MLCGSMGSERCQVNASKARKIVYSLKDIACCLRALLFLLFLDIDIPPDDNGSHDKRHHADTSNNHFSLNVSVRPDDGVPFGRAIEVGHLQLHVSENLGGHVLALLGEPSVELGGKDVVPHRACNSEADRSADGAKHAPDCEHDGDFLVADDGHDGELAADGEEAGANADEDLGDGDGANGSVRLAEGN